MKVLKLVGVLRNFLITVFEKLKKMKIPCVIYIVIDVSDVIYEKWIEFASHVSTWRVATCSTLSDENGL